MFNLTLIYIDNTTFFVGSFETLEHLNNWLDEEKTRSYWQVTTTWEINDLSNQ